MSRKLLVFFSQFSGIPQVTTLAEAKSSNGIPPDYQLLLHPSLLFRLSCRFLHEVNLLRTPLIPPASSVLLDALALR
jgi:hypothetical protein